MDEDIWKVLEIKARETRSTISDLVRAAVREKYLASPIRKTELLKSIAGLWHDRDDLGDTEAYVRRVRRGDRIRRLYK